MLYLLVSIAHYRQLARIEQELIASLEAEIGSACSRQGVAWRLLQDGAAVLALGAEDRLDPRHALEVAFAIAAVLAQNREALYGFQLLLAVLEELPEEAAAKQLRRLLASCEEDGELWIEPGAAPLFSGLVGSQQVGELWKVTDRSLPKETPREPRPLAWVQERLVYQAFELLAAQLEGKAKGRGLHLHGPVSQDRRGVVDALQERLLGLAPVRRFPRLYCLFQRRSALHPFLNSIDPAFLPSVGLYLEPHEKAIWDGLADLLDFLRPVAPLAARPSAVLGWPDGWPGELSLRGAPPGPPPEARSRRRVELWPDHLSEDFLLAYQLYLTAYFRLLEENCQPALLLCEDLDSYPPASLRLLALLLKDFGRSPSFLPIFSSGRPELPEGLGARGPVRLAVRPLRLGEMARLASEQFPGLHLPRQDWLWPSSTACWPASGGG